VGSLVWATLLLLAASEISNAEETYQCSIERVCKNMSSCRLVPGGPVFFYIEPDGIASVFDGHKSTPYQLVSTAEGSRSFFSDDHGDFPSLWTIYEDGSFIDSIHVAQPKRARPDEVGPFQFVGTCKRIDG
jgi:hypothetical protein